MAAAPITAPGRAAMLKSPETWTEGEMKEVIAAAQGGFRGWKSGDPLKTQMFDAVGDWHRHVYGDGEQQVDDTGKPVEPQPIRPIPAEAAPPLTPDGEDLWQATARLGRKLAGSGNLPEAVGGLQRGLNMLDTDRAPLAEDGVYGPQTDYALKRATARLGPARVEEALALGRFNRFARQAERDGSAEGLAATTQGAFAPLFRAPGDAKAPKVEAGILQETLNAHGGRTFDDWQPLKVDGWIGPKTTEAFARLLPEHGADALTAAYGRGLGLN
ncbi:MAG: hypothetical protein HY985_10985 [Magnetospirillum sp.]|nr:hypothetical protein [Magnetospirillum sp.]